MRFTTLTARLKDVEERIAAAAARTQRDPSSVTLVAVSKTWPVETILEALHAGVTDLGENRAHEFKQKVAVVGNGPRWHFVGHLQTNKVRSVVGQAALIHSVDRFGLAEAIARRAGVLGITQDVLIEVNVSGETSKHGIEPLRAGALAEEIAALDGINVRGLMTMAPFTDDPQSSRPHFQALRDLAGPLRERVPEAGELSMGMTRDFEVAVEEGATLVRVGEGIFGARS
ncbi:MAG: YggS family pyridoxal phosphate-dependent enzyme [Actinomycetota bacterium]